MSRRLTHGHFERRTLSGRVAESWDGAVEEILSRMRDHGKNLVNRGGGYTSIYFHAKVMCACDTLCLNRVHH